MFHIIWSIIVGFVVGLVAGYIMHDSHGFWITALIGIGGSVVGGFIGSLFSKPEPGSKFHTAGFLMSIVGAVVLIWVLRLLGI